MAGRARGSPGDHPVRQGEFLSIRERVVVAPAWGRLAREPVDGGGRVRRGAVIGWLRTREGDIPLLAPVSGVFLAWLAGEGERVPPGRAVAWLRGPGVSEGRPGGAEGNGGGRMR